MLQRMHQRTQGMVTWIIVLFIAAAFAFFGLSDYFSSRGDGQIAAKVNGEKISWRYVDALFQRMQRQVGENNDAKMLREQLRYALVQRLVLLNEAKKLGFQVGDLQIAETLFQIPAFQVDGKFSKEKYLQVLQQEAYTDQGFRQELAQDVLLAQLEQGLAISSFSLRPEVLRVAELLDQKRDFGYLLMPIQKFKQDIVIPKEEIAKFYEEHQTQFVLPEQISLEYVELSLNDLANKIQISDDQLKAYYEEHKASYSAPERVQARHILISVPANASKEQDEKAKNEAAAILDQIKGGADFAKLAAEKSRDTQSGKKGGDLGWFAKGQMVPEFEKAVFALNKANELAGPVKTNFGYHIIQLIEHKPAETRPFKEVAALIKEQVQREKAQALLAEKNEQMAKLAFEQTQSLKPIVEQMNLKLRETPLFSRKGGQDKITKNAEVLQLGFSDAILKQGQNSAVIKIDEDSSVVFRLKKHQAAKQQTLAEVEKNIQDHLRLEKAQTLAKEAASALVKRIEAKENPSKIAKEKGLNWIEKTGVVRANNELDRHVLAAAFQAAYPSDKKPSVSMLLLPSKEYLILAVNKIHEGDFAKLDDAMKQNYRQGLAEVLGQLEFALYANHALSQAKIELSENKSE